MKLDRSGLEALAAALTKLEEGVAAMPELEPPPQPHADARMSEVLQEVAHRLQDNYPYFHPLYAGQMLKPPHPVARAAYALAMWVNPNNHALDGGKASSAMEVEAVEAIARLFGWQQHLGHLTSGGTFANLEALWVAGELAPGKKIVASEQAHYTHARISSVLKLPFASVPCDHRGRMDVAALERMLHAGDIGTVVVTLGTTATGSVDPLPEVVALRERYNFRIHVDAAYGGYFVLAENLGGEACNAFDIISLADSIVVDPHKHGLQPYGCGCVLFRNPSVGRFYKHDSPYTYFTSQDLHLGEISLECSRAGAAAVALWATQRMLPMEAGGEFARGLEAGHTAAISLYRRLHADPRFVTAFEPQLDIVVWAVKGASMEESSRLAQKLFDAAEKQHLYLALAKLPVRFFPEGTWPRSGPQSDPAVQSEQEGYVTCLRSVLMKPEHLKWMDEIWSRLSHR